MDLGKSSSGDSADSDPKSPSAMDTTYLGVRRDVAKKFIEKGKQQLALERKNAEAATAARIEKQKKEWEGLRVEGGKTHRRSKKSKKSHRKTKVRRRR